MRDFRLDYSEEKENNLDFQDCHGQQLVSCNTIVTCVWLYDTNDDPFD